MSSVGPLVPMAPAQDTFGLRPSRSSSSPALQALREEIKPSLQRAASDAVPRDIDALVEQRLQTDASASAGLLRHSRHLALPWMTRALRRAE
ncbi:MAG: hypothetical protein MHM6MM_003887, partial [Cercozoa sp. M6MM]